MRVAVSGSTGLIGSALCARLRGRGDDVVPLVRSEDRDGVLWDPDGGRVDAAGLEDLDAVVHLAGENLVGLWTRSKRRRIRDSRVEGTRLLADALAGLDRPPAVLVSGSAVGFYGDTGDTKVDESAPVGDGFLADTCRAWEDAAGPATDAGVRTVFARTGLVLSPEGGLLDAMLTPAKLGLGCRIGSGAQWQPWITLQDEVSALLFLLDDDGCTGPFNLCAPSPVTNREFSDTLADVLGRPQLLPMPAFMARLAPGGMGEEMLLAGQRAVPRALLAAGFEFDHVDLEKALRDLLDVEAADGR